MTSKKDEIFDHESRSEAGKVLPALGMWGRTCLGCPGGMLKKPQILAPSFDKLKDEAGRYRQLGPHGELVEPLAAWFFVLLVAFAGLLPG